MDTTGQKNTQVPVGVGGRKIKNMKNNQLTVINMFGSCGVGKSTTAAGLFHLMKLDGYNVELVTEYAKDITWAEHFKLLEEESALIFSEQNHRLNRLRGKVDFAITDSPLPLSLFYAPSTFPKTFGPFVMDIFDTYNNFNFYLSRAKPYIAVGRNQTEEESNKIANNILTFLNENNIEYQSLAADRVAASHLYTRVLNEWLISIQE